MHDLSSAAGIAALAAGGIAALALATTGVLAARLRRVRLAQRVLLGDHDDHDLIEHAARLTREFDDLQAFVEDTAGRLHARMAGAEERLDGAITYRALVRYDAYGEMSGRQSTTIALLDASRSGVVLSSIHHRDQARLYAKRVRDGSGELKLSPEEEEAVRLALSPERERAQAEP